MYKNPALTVDAVIVTDGKIVLIKRKEGPFQGQYALPGGFVEYGETVEAALRREVFEETGLVVQVISLIGIYSDPHRDPRGHIISAAFGAEIVSGVLAGGSDAAEAIFWEITHLPPLAFDHAQIIQDALRSL
jgi:8-oxo-dGTP diphosphatase